MGIVYFVLGLGVLYYIIIGIILLIPEKGIKNNNLENIKKESNYSQNIDLQIYNNDAFGLFSEEQLNLSQKSHNNKVHLNNINNSALNKEIDRNVETTHSLDGDVDYTTIENVSNKDSVKELNPSKNQVIDQVVESVSYAIESDMKSDEGRSEIGIAEDEIDAVFERTKRAIYNNSEFMNTKMDIAFEQLDADFDELMKSSEADYLVSVVSVNSDEYVGVDLVTEL